MCRDKLYVAKTLNIIEIVKLKMLKIKFTPFKDKQFITQAGTFIFLK